MDRDRKRQILAAENRERLARSLAAHGVYVMGGLGFHGVSPGGVADEDAGVGAEPSNRTLEPSGGETMTNHPKRDADPSTPHAVRAPREAGTPDQLKDHAAEAENRQEALIDEAVEETFPASDPVSAKRIT